MYNNYVEVDRSSKILPSLQVVVYALDRTSTTMTCKEGIIFKESRMNEKCIVDGCEKRRENHRKYCSMHRNRLRLTGRIDKIIRPKNVPCSIEGCNKIRETRLYCNMHYRRILKNGNPFHLIKSPIERTLEKTTKIPTACWIYTGCKDHGGYGKLSVHRKQLFVHRLSYEHYKGEIPARMKVLHTCDTPACVNPDHLWLGTQADNVRDMSNRGRNWTQRVKAQGLKFCQCKRIYPVGYKRISSEIK